MLNVIRQRPYFFLLCLLLVVKATWAVFFILKGPIHLVPDEAQYWLWSQDLSWGYYSKPPGIALQIAAGTRLFGNTELGVRFGSIIISFLTSLSVFCLSRQCGLSEKICFWAGVVMAFSPIGMIGTLYATTDWGLILFWTLAFVFLARAVHKQTGPHYVLLGLCILCGALFKWTIYLIWVPIFAYVLYDPKWRKSGIVLALFISLLGLLPSVIWNADHDWATFRHVWTQSTGGEASAAWNGNPIEFLGAQIALLSPIYFFLLIGAFVKLRKGDLSVRLCGGASLLILSAYFLFSFFHKMQGNWAMYAYPTGIVALSWYGRSSRVLAWGTVVSLLFFFSIISLTYLQSTGSGESIQIPFKTNPFRANLGWDRLPFALEKAGYSPNDHFLAADKYQTSSLISFYSRGQKRAYFLNLFGRRKNQFSFWPSLQKREKGKDGFFVVLEDQVREPIQEQKILALYQSKLSPYFDELIYKGNFPLFSAYGKEVKFAFIFYGKNYNGFALEDPQKY